MEEYRAGGLNAPVKIDMGHDPLQLTLTLAEFDGQLIKSWGVTDMAAVPLRFRAALERDGINHVVEGYEIIARGRLSEIDNGTAKSGEANSPKYKLELVYYKESLATETLVEIDLMNMTEVVGGVDRLAEVRSALGI